jgi:hypothetical protein
MEVLEEHKCHLLAIEENKWKLKRWAIWLEEGENNTNGF